MKKAKSYYKDINTIRFFSCIAVLLYHLNILPGGFLAVCTFFVLTAYLSVKSAFKEKKFSIKKYYLNRLLKIYLPLLIVVLITVGVISLIPNISWLNLKPETTSVLLGYNNFWQLSANLDYFARNINSPFIHFWYMGILIQFEIIFPLIFIGCKKLEKRFKKIVPCIVTSFLGIASFAFFALLSLNNNIMGAYYNTLARIFSLLFGTSLGFIHKYYSKKIKNSLKTKKDSRIVFWSYIILLAVMFVFVDADSIFMIPSMFLTTIISCRLIDYAVNNKRKDKSKLDYIIKSVSSISYEIYLVQYPVIFLLQEIGFNKIINILLAIIVTFVISYILHFVLDYKNEKYKKIRIALMIVVGVLTLFGGYKFVISKDYTAEMKELEAELNENEQLILEKQKEFADASRVEDEEWLKELEKTEVTEEELKEIIKNLRITGVGDSVMLGAVNALYDVFPNGYFDAKISRTAWVANGILKDLNNKNLLGDTIILNLGANGDCPLSCKKEIMTTLEGKEVFWLTVTNDKKVGVNDKLKELAIEYENLHIIDWNELSKDHKEYFVADGIHLTEEGKKAYTDAIINELYNAYLEKYQKEKDKLIKEKEEKEKQKITFWGNDVILNLYPYIKNDFIKDKYVIDKSNDIDSLIKELKNYINKKELNHRVVLAIDSYLYVLEKDYERIINMCKDYEIYIILTKQINYSNLKNYENVKVVDFYEEIKNKNEYLMENKIHLSGLGNEALREKIIELLKK